LPPFPTASAILLALEVAVHQGPSPFEHDPTPSG
jgi:hypothetical protein